jgi:hypothetical protein
MEEKEFIERWTDSTATVADAICVLKYMQRGNTWCVIDDNQNLDQVNSIMKKMVFNTGETRFMVEWSSPNGEYDSVSWLDESEMTNCQEIVRLTTFKKSITDERGVLWSKPMVDLTKSRLGSSYGECRQYLLRSLARSFAGLENACLLYITCELIQEINKTVITTSIRQLIQTLLSTSTARGAKDTFSRAAEILRSHSLVATRCKKSNGISWVDYLKIQTVGMFMCKTTTSLKIPACHCFMVNCSTKKKRIYDLHPRYKDLACFKDVIVCVWRVVSVEQQQI